MSTKSHLSVQEIAQTLDVSPFTVHSWIRTGKLEATKIGKAYQISRQDFEAWWEKQGSRPKQVASGEVLEPELSALFQDWLLDLTNGTKPCMATTVITHRAHLLKYIRIVLDVSASDRLTYRKAINVTFTQETGTAKKWSLRECDSYPTKRRNSREDQQVHH